MKKLLYLIATLAILCFAAGCQREVDIDPVKGELVETEFTVSIDDAVATKAVANDGHFVNELIVRAYKTDGTLLNELNENFEIELLNETTSAGYKQFAVKAKLVRNFTYKIAFFAYYKPENGTAAYSVGNDGIITMNTTGLVANDETLDAFYKITELSLVPDATTGVVATQSVTLTRPLAQINVLSDPTDWAAAELVGITTNLESSLSIAAAPNKLDLWDGSISGSETLAFAQATIPGGTIDVGTEQSPMNATHVVMGYVFSSSSAANLNITFAVPGDGADFAGFTRTVANVPNKANFRTNMHGDLFTTYGDFTVEIDPNWDGEDPNNQNINIPQPTVSPLSTIPDAITTANPDIQPPTITTGNNVTTNMADGKLFFGIDSNSDGAITYSSSDHNVGTIDNDGVFTPVGPGTTNITVTQAAGTQTKAIGDPLAEITIVYHVTVVETTYAISKNTPENGTLAIKIGENEVTEAAAAATITVATEPAAGYELATLTYTPEGESPVDIKDAGSFTMPAKAVEVNATFSLIPPSQYAITKSTENGTFKVKVGSEEVTTATEGATVVISDYEGATGYEFASVSVKKNSNNDAVSVSENSFTMPGEAVTVTVVFSKINYTITKNAVSNGSITVSAETANYGDEITLTATAADGYSFGAWDVKQGETAVTVTDNKFTMPAGNVTVDATFTQNAPVRTLQSITLGGSYPTEFDKDAAFSYTGLIVTANYNVAPLTEEVASGYSVSTPAMDSRGQKEVTVTYNDKTAYYNIGVFETLATPELDGGMAEVAATTIELPWDAVTNATSYTATYVVKNSGNNPTSATVDMSQASTPSIAIDNLTASTTYTITVVAKNTSDDYLRDSNAATVDITTSAAPKIATSIVIEENTAEIAVDGTFQIEASVKDAQNNVLTSGVSLSYSISNSDPANVISVSNTGLVTGLLAGMAEVTVSATVPEAYSAPDVQTVTIEVTASNPPAGGYTITFSADEHGSFAEIKKGGVDATLTNGALEANTGDIITFKFNASSDDYAVNTVKVGNTNVTVSNGTYSYTVESANATIAGTTRAKEWNLVTNSANLKDGDIVTFAIYNTTVGSATYSDVIGAFNSSNYFTVVGTESSFSSDGNKLASLPSGATTFELSVVSGGWNIYDRANNKYINGPSTATNKVYEAESATTTWVISITNNNASIVGPNISSKDYKLQWNANSGTPRFSCYAGTMKDIRIYKYE